MFNQHPKNKHDILDGGQVKKFNGTIYFVNPSLLFDGEIFVDIDGSVVPGIYDYYQISNYGRVFHRYLNKFIKIGYDGTANRYQFFMASTEFGPRPVSIHRMVLIHFGSYLPPNYNELQVNHIDGNPHNNHISNLEWNTRSENILHSYRTGLHPVGEENVLSKIDSNTAKEICELLSTGQYTNEDIAVMIGGNVTTNIVSCIKQGNAWNYISKDYTFYSRPGRLFTDEQIHNLCKYFESVNRGCLTINEHCRNALRYYGYDDSDRYVETVRKIFGKKHFTSISCNYNF